MKNPSAFAAARHDTRFYRVPAGRSLLIVLAAQMAIVWVPPAAVAGLSGLLLLAATIARRPVHAVLLGAWPVLVLALITALRADSAAIADRIAVFMRFCFMIVAADFYITSFSWQPALARLATASLSDIPGGAGTCRSFNTPTGAGASRALDETVRRAGRRTSTTVATVALLLWLAVLHIPGVAARLRARREAALARGVPLRRLLAPAALSSLLTELIDDADTRAEAIAARGLLSENSVSGSAHFHE